MYSHEDLVNHQRFMYAYDLTGRLVRQSVLNGSKKRIYDAEYGYDMNNNVSKFTSSAGGVSMTERFDYTISLSKPARRRKYKVQNAVLCGGVFCA